MSVTRLRDQSVRLFVADPQRLEDRVGRIEVRADVRVELRRRQPFGEGRRLRLSPSVHPDHRRTQRASVRVAHDHPVQLRAEGQPLDRADAPPGHSATSRRQVRSTAPSTDVGSCSAHVGLREREVVCLVRRGDQRAVHGVEGGVRALTADVAPDDVRRGSRDDHHLQAGARPDRLERVARSAPAGTDASRRRSQVRRDGGPGSPS